MQCPVCQNEVGSENAFCNKCGAPLAGAAPGTGAPPPPAYSSVPPAYTNVPPAAAGSGLSDNAAGAIAYITIIPAIIFLVLEPYNKSPFVRFHSWQSIGLFVAGFLLHVVVTIAQMALHFIPGIFLLFTLVHLAVSVGLFCIWLIVLLKASKGEWYKLPYIGDFAEKQARGGGI